MPATTPSVIGGDIGYYLVHSNAEGGRVYFDSDYKGQIANGVLNVPVYVTGTPYRAWSVTKEGYATFNETLSVYPSKGQTIDLQAVLTLLPATNATTAVPATTKAPLSPRLHRRRPALARGPRARGPAALNLPLSFRYTSPPDRHGPSRDVRRADGEEP